MSNRKPVDYARLDRMIEVSNPGSTTNPTGDVAGLHPDTALLVDRFAKALKLKLRDAQAKRGLSDEWKLPGWFDECRAKLIEHVGKGDPRDVAAYCAFLWHHGERTELADAPPAAPEDRRDGERSGGEFDQKDVEAMRGISPVTAWLHQVVCDDGEPDQALSFAPDNFPLQGVVGYRSLSHKPLYLHPAVISEPTDVALNVNHIDCHKAADAFWAYWQANGETHKHGYYESTWGAINAALRTVGVVPHEWVHAALDAAREG